MNLKEKQAAVEELTEKLRTAQAFYLTDFSGLNVKSMTDLRAQLRRAGVEYVVVKNTLARRALAGLELSEIAGFFTGPTGLVIGREDPVIAAKIVEEFARAHDNRPAVKAGMVENRAVSAQEIGRIASLPPRDQLLAELAGALQAPLVECGFALQGRLQEVAGLLEALRSEREGA